MPASWPSKFPSMENRKRKKPVSRGNSFPKRIGQRERNQRGACESLEMSNFVDAGGGVYPKQDCPHLSNIPFIDINAVKQGVELNCCNDCNCSDEMSRKENWLCLSCGNTKCSRYVGSHMENHYFDTLFSDPNMIGHCIALSLSDLSIWCYACENYIKHDKLKQTSKVAEIVKFQNNDVTQYLNQSDGGNNRYPVGFICINNELQKLHNYPNVYECANRVTSVYNFLENKYLLAKLNSVLITPNIRSQLDELLLTTHSVDHVFNVKNNSLPKQPDIYTTPGTYNAATEAVLCAVSLTDYLCRDEVKSGFALIRPPGHHAESNGPAGFCFFNNVCISANYALSKYPEKIKKIAIVDIDIHHGNAAQKHFYNNNNVLTISVHKQIYGTIKSCSNTSTLDVIAECDENEDEEEGNDTDVYEYDEVGKMHNIGNGSGEGYNINIPLGVGDATNGGLNDIDYIALFHQIILPILDEFQADMVMMPLGFDAGIGDVNLPVGGYSITPTGYYNLIKLIQAHCNDRLLICLEGGYNIHGLCHSVEATIESLLDHNNQSLSEKYEIINATYEDVHPDTVNTINILKTKFGPYWNNLRN